MEDDAEEVVEEDMISREKVQVEGKGMIIQTMWKYAQIGNKIKTTCGEDDEVEDEFEVEEIGNKK